MIVPLRVKKDVLKDLPDKLEEVRYVQMGKEQQKLYDAEVLRMKKDLSKQTDEDLRKGKPQVLAAITRIRQICCDPLLCFDGYKGGIRQERGGYGSDSPEGGQYRIEPDRYGSCYVTGFK